MRNKSRFLIFLLTGILLLAIIGIFIFQNRYTSEKLEVSNLKTAVVEKGKVSSSLKVLGEIKAGNEVMLTAPVRSSIKKVLKKPGNTVKEGDKILQLNNSNTKKELSRIIGQLKIKQNSLTKMQLNEQSIRLDLGYNEEVKQRNLSSLQATLKEQEKRLKKGEISAIRIEKTKQEISLAEKELKILTRKNAIRLKQLAADQKGAKLQIEGQRRALNEKREVLTQLEIKAPCNGVILELNENEGARVDINRPLARLSTLDYFKAVASTSIQYSEQVKTGGKAIVTINNKRLEGWVGTIKTDNENNTITFNVHLNNNKHPELIANKNAEIEIRSKSNTDVLRIKKSSIFDNRKEYSVFVVKGNEAIKTEIILGKIGDNYCEIVSGLNEGDTIILDEKINKKKARSIKIKN